MTNFQRTKASIKMIQRQADIEAFAAEKLKADIDFARLPIWQQAVLEGDRLNDGSDEQEYDEDLN